MPELIRLKTPDFEFSVWASDINQRAKVYHNTVTSRASLTANLNSCATHNTSLQLHRDTEVRSVSTYTNHSQRSYELRFSPATELNDIKAPQELIASCFAVSDKNRHTELTLNAPIFFENTQYQFEWIFFNEVSNARLTHRSQIVNEAFRFSPEVKTTRGAIPARITGTINTGNDVGWLSLPLAYELNGKTQTQHIAFEVLPTKMALHQDLPAMYQAIDKVYPLWRFSLVEKTEQNASTSQKRGYFPLMWLANFTALRERFEQGLKVICAAPHSRLQSTVANIKAAKLKGRLPHNLAERIKQDFATGQYDKRYKIYKKQLSVDTPENRFIKMAVTRSKRQLAEFEQKLRQSNQAPERQRLSDSFLNSLHSWQQPLQKVLNQSFLKEVSAYTGLTRESLVLQQKTGYSTVYRVWQELKFYLDVFGNQSNISMKSVAEIYEVWCFLYLKQILERELGFELVDDLSPKLSQNDFFEYQLKDGFAGAFRFKRSDGVTARLAHEPKFTKKGKSIRSYIVNQEPDIVLEVSLPKDANLNSDEDKQFIWLFDAKYRIKTDVNRFDDSVSDIETTDYVPDEAINQMHRYRDALIRLSDSPSSSNNQFTKKSRPVFGAFALYPGFFDQASKQNPYAAAIEEVGIGAFALLPSQTEQVGSGGLWLLEFLKAQIGIVPAIMGERLQVQEAARIPYYGMRQVLYPNLIMTVSLSGQRNRNSEYFEGFKRGDAQWYHLPKNTFSQKFKQHIAEEIHYIALASTSKALNSTKQIDKIWPVKHVKILPRCFITEEQAGRKSNSTELYYLFELGKPLTLQTPVTNVPHRPIANSMKLTTLALLEKANRFAEIESVYKGAL